MAKNILFLLVDQWPADCFGHRDSVIKTPNIDRLAKEGSLFTNAFTTCPLCSPARGALFTGMWHTQSKMLDNLNVGYSQQEPLDLSQKTWLDEAVSSGYHVGYYGKWHLGANGPIIRGVQRHPDEIETKTSYYTPGVSTYNYKNCYETYQKDNDFLEKGIAPFYGNTDSLIENSKPIIIANQGVEFIKEYAAQEISQPFLLTVSINDPHFPHYLPESFVEECGVLDIKLPDNIDDDFKDKPWFQNKSWWPSMDTTKLSKSDWKEVVKYAYMHRMLVDKALGKVIDELERTGLLEETTIVFTGDHGDMCGAHNRFDKGPYYYDEVWRIPLIIREPNKKPVINNELISSLDISASVFDMVGSYHLKHVIGNSLCDKVGSNETTKLNKEVYGMYDLYNGMSFKVRAIRNATHKYIYNAQAINEFYDMVNDPYELNNLVENNQLIENSELMTTKNKLEEKLFKWMEDIDDPLLGDIDILPEAGTIVPLGVMGP